MRVKFIGSAPILGVFPGILPGKMVRQDGSGRMPDRARWKRALPRAAAERAPDFWRGSAARSIIYSGWHQDL